MKTEHFRVSGMTCSACLSHIETAVRHICGVTDVHINLLTNRMTVTCADNSVSVQTVIQAVIASGYGAEVLSQSTVGTAGITPSAENVNSTDAKKRFKLSLYFLFPLMYLAMGHMVGMPLPWFFLGVEHSLAFVFTQFLLTIPIIVLNRHIFLNGFKMLKQGTPSMNSLIAIGAGASVCYGIFVIYRIGHCLGHQDTVGAAWYVKNVYFESASMILTIIALGTFLENRAKKKTSAALTQLMLLRPKTACVVRNGIETDIAADAIVQGDMVVIRPGDTIPVDGIIMEGISSLDESAVTGESIPIEKTVGDHVISASHNLSGSFVFRAEKVGVETALSKIIALVEEASSSKAPIAKLADKISSWFVPIIILISIVAFFSWLLVGVPFEFAFSHAVAVLVISCPCALGLATPAAVMAGTGRGAQLGILIKSAESLEKARTITTVLFDKTGTLTNGTPILQDIIVFDSVYSADSVLQVAYSLERLSKHPLAHAIMTAAEANDSSFFGITDFTAVHGKGIYGCISSCTDANGVSQQLPVGMQRGMVIAAGNQRLVEQMGITIPPSVTAAVLAGAANGYSPLLVCAGGICIGLITVSDPVRSGSSRAIEAFHALGIHTVMLTGDNRKTAEAVQKAVGVQECYAELLPQDKKALVEKYRQNGQAAAFIGDGINDAPALAVADIGIAVYGGTDIAVESADIVLMNNNPETAVTAFLLSKAVMRTIRQNLFWALFYNALCIPLAAGAFYYPFGITLTPMFAAAAMSFSSLSVVTNALRLSRFKLADNTDKHTGSSVEHTSLLHYNTPISEEERQMNITTILTIEGMSCEHCSSRVEKALTALYGVSSVVNLEQKTATVIHPDSITADELAKIVTDAGYTATVSA